MPILTPLPKEQRGEFIQRCMMNDSMVREFKDQDQRYAVCVNQLEKHELNEKRKTKKNR